MKKYLKSLCVLFSILFILSVVSCSIPEKYKKGENKAIVFFNEAGSHTPIYASEKEFDDIVAGQGNAVDKKQALASIRTYKNTSDGTYEGDLISGLRKEAVAGFKNFNNKILDGTLKEAFDKMPSLLQSSINGKYPWLKVVNTAKVTIKDGTGDRTPYGEADPFKLVNATPMKETKNKFFEGKVGQSEDWAVSVRITGWFIYAKAVLPITVGGLPTLGETHQKIMMEATIYDKKTKSRIFSKTAKSDILMNKKLFPKIGEDSSSEDIEDWNKKTSSQIQELIDSLITAMNK